MVNGAEEILPGILILNSVMDVLLPGLFACEIQ